MAYGFQTFAADGTKLIDTSSRLARAAAFIQTTIVGAVTQTISVPGMLPDGNWFVMIDHHLCELVSIDVGSFTFSNLQNNTIVQYVDIMVFRVN